MKPHFAKTGVFVGPKPVTKVTGALLKHASAKRNMYMYLDRLLFT